MRAQPIPISDYQKNELEKRLQHPDSEQALGSRLHNALRVLRAHASGCRVCEIQRKTGATKQGVQGILNRRKKPGGLDRELAKAHDAFERWGKKNAFTIAKGRGRPRKKAWRLLSPYKPDGEAVVELVSLVFRRGAKVAIFGIRSKDWRGPTEGRDPGGRDTWMGKLADAVRYALKQREEFSERHQDLERGTALGTLRYLRKNMEHSAGNFSAMGEPPAPPPLSQRFPGREWHFVVVRSGGPEACNALERRLVEGVNSESHDWEQPGEFMDRLIAAIAWLTDYMNFRGLFPSFRELSGYRLCKEWYSQFAWHSDIGLVNFGLRLAMAEFFLFGAMGFISSLTLPMMEKVRVKDRFAAGAFSSPPEITVKLAHEDGNSLIITHSPMPGVAFDHRLELAGLDDSAEDAARELASALRDLLLSHKDTWKFEYIICPRPDQRTEGFLPFLHCLTRFWRWDEDKRVILMSPPEIAAIPVFRHFRFPAPAEDLEILQGLASESGHKAAVIDRARRCKSANPGEVAVFRSRHLLDAIESAWRTQIYGEAVARFNRAKNVVQKILVSPFHPPAYEGPDFFYFDDEALSGRDDSPETLQRLLNCGLRKYRRPAGANARGAENLTYPTYNRDQAHLNLYRCLDADFLLRGIWVQDWEILMEEAHQWANLRAKIILEEFNPRVILDQAKFRTAIGPFSGDIDELFAGTLAKFCVPSSRILTQSLENAQRLVLGGLPPLAIAMESKKAILAKFSNYAKSRAKGALPEPEWFSEEYDDEYSYFCRTGMKTKECSSDGKGLRGEDN